MEEEKSPDTIIGSKVLECESGRGVLVRKHRIVAGAAAPLGAWEPISPGRKISVASTTSSKRRKQIDDVPAMPVMPQVSVGMRGEFCYEGQLHKIEIIESSSSDSSGQDAVHVVNFLDRRGRRTNAYTEEVLMSELRCLDCSNPVGSILSNREKSTSKPICTEMSLRAPVYETMMSHCRTSSFSSDGSRKEDNTHPSYAPGYVKKVLEGDEIEFQFFGTNHETATRRKATDLLFVASPSVIGSAVTECERVVGPPRIRHVAATQIDDEDGNERDVNISDPILRDNETKKRTSKDDVRKRPARNGTPREAIPAEKKRKRHDTSHAALSTELEYNPVCPICLEDFSTDLSSCNEIRLSQLPVLSRVCSHRVCCGCLSWWQAVKTARCKLPKKDRPDPKWMRCPVCSRHTAFNAVEMPVDNLLCECLNRIKRLEAEVESLKDGAK